MTPLLQPSDFDNAPDDDARAFLFLEELARNRMYLASEEDINGNPIFPLRNEYMTRVSSLAESYGITGIDFNNNCLNFDIEFNRFILCVDYKNTQLSAALSKESRKSVIALTGPQRDKIRHHIAQIRDAIEKTNLVVKRKKSIIQRLDELEKELEEPSSSLKRILIVSAMILSIGADSSEVADPLGDAAIAIIRIAGEARLEADEQQLPRISPPLRQIEGPKNLGRPSDVSAQGTDGPF